MKITFQGEKTETRAANTADFLAERGVSAKESVIELNGGILIGEDALASPLEEDAAINAYRIVAGG